jgi:hypothetical protein
MEKTYTLADMVEFGNYILSKERKSRTSIIVQDGVSHADLENWKELMKQLKELYND